MSKSEPNAVDASECSNLNCSDNGNPTSVPSSSSVNVSLDVKLTPKKRSNSPEEFHFSNKEKSKHLRYSKRKKEELSKNLLEEESNKNTKPDISKVQKEEPLCQTSDTSSALSESRENSESKMDLLVPNIDDTINIASSSITDTNLKPPLNDNNNSAQGPNDKLRYKKRKKSLPKWSAKKNIQINETIKNGNDSYNTKDNTSNQENFEEELICSICSEIFISAVTLNCSHSFCKYCITKWRKDHSTCPICRQDILSQNSTLVLDKCVERILETSKEETKEHRKEIIEYREKNKEPDPQAPTIPNNNHSSDAFDDEIVWANDESSEDEQDFYNDDYLDDADYYDDDYYYDEESEYEEDGDEEHIEGGDNNEDIGADFEEEGGSEGEGDLEEEGDYDEEGGEEEDYEEEEEYQDDEDEYTAGEDNESEQEEEENEYNEDSYEETDYDEDEDDDSDDDYRCFNCGLQGHFARECPTRVAYTGISGAYYGGYGNCFKCKRVGHWANGCPN